MHVWQLSVDFKSQKFRDLKIVSECAVSTSQQEHTRKSQERDHQARLEAGEAITVKDVKAATKATTAMASRTNDWQEHLRRGFRQALKLAERLRYLRPTGARRIRAGAGATDTRVLRAAPQAAARGKEEGAGAGRLLRPPIKSSSMASCSLMRRPSKKHGNRPLGLVGC